jgi:group II intron reverse transcriptase/maturase
MSVGKARHQMSAQAERSSNVSGEAASAGGSGEARLVRQAISDSGRANLLAQALTRENAGLAWKRVKANAGSAGSDGLTIRQTAEHLKAHWPAIREQLHAGTYRPQPVRRVQIPKPDGGMRELGIPTVTDRLIQQALRQVLQPLLDPGFSESSYGFRPGRRALDAVCRAQQYVQAGYRTVVDIDLEKFFDRVNHDVLMDRLGKRVTDQAVLRLIRRYLQAGIMRHGVVQERVEGTPQGGPLSPLLANVLLDDVDRYLERRGHHFVRYADDCNVYVRSRRAGLRVMAALRKQYARLRLKINDTKSTVASAFGRKFLGYSLWAAPGGDVKRSVAIKARATFKQRVRRLTQRNGGRSMQEVADRLREYLLGWKTYFRLAQTPHVMRELDEWLRHRLRALQLKQWRRGKTMYRELRALGASSAQAARIAGNARRWWHNSRYEVNRILPIGYFDRLGIPRLS